jgi:hypothetical protein
MQAKKLHGINIRNLTEEWVSDGRYLIKPKSEKLIDFKYLTNVPAGFSGDYDDLDNIPTEFTPVAHDNTYHTENYLVDITSESIGDLVDVDITGITDNKILIWDTDKFVITDLPSAPSYTASNGVTIDSDDIQLDLASLTDGTIDFDNDLFVFIDTSDTNNEKKVGMSIFIDTFLKLDQTVQQTITGGPKTDFIDFNLNYTAGAVEGRLRWSNNDGCLEVGLPGGNVNLQIGQEHLIRVKANENILNGQVVYISAAASAIPQVNLANASIDVKSCVIGVATESISNNQHGYITTQGIVRDINTNGFTEGTKIWLSTSNGAFTATRPTAPNNGILIGYVIRESATVGVILVSIEHVPDLQTLSDVAGTPVNGSFPKYNLSNTRFEYDNTENYKTYCGFENRTASNISISGAGVFTISAVSAITGYNVWINCARYNITSSRTVTITDDQTISFIYFDSTGVLQKSTSFWNIASGTDAPVAIVFKDGSSYTLMDERHNYARDRVWHNWAHSNIGCMYSSGFTGTFTNTTLSVTQGVISDEDIVFDSLTTKTSTSLWYRNATTGMRMIRNSTTPYYAAAGVLRYDNGSGTLQPVTNNRYSTQWVYAAGDSTEPIYTVIGQNNDTSVTNARNTALPTIRLSTAEWKLLYRVIYRNVGGVATFVEAADFRTVQTGVPTSATSTDHASLINREVANSHPSTAISHGDGTVNDSVTLFELEFARKTAYNSYMEYTLTGSDITQVDYWTDNGKLTKLFTRVLIYSSGNPTQVVTTDSINGKILTTTIAYTGSDISSVTKVIT